jgi:hypothetical protein
MAILPRCPSALAFVLLVLAAVSLSAAETPPFTVAPGPVTMSAEEAAIAADPAQGIEGAVILLDETDRDESPVGSGQVARHVRAKILSNDGRSLGDITIPYDIHRGKLLKFWGRTILPDGKSLGLYDQELKAQEQASYGGFATAFLKGALPGVVPGA